MLCTCKSWLVTEQCPICLLFYRISQISSNCIRCYCYDWALSTFTKLKSQLFWYQFDVPSQWFCVQLIRFGQPYAAVSVSPLPSLQCCPREWTATAKLQPDATHLGTCSVEQPRNPRESELSGWQWGHLLGSWPNPGKFGHILVILTTYTEHDTCKLDQEFIDVS